MSRIEQQPSAINARNRAPTSAKRTRNRHENDTVPTRFLHGFSPPEKPHPSYAPRLAPTRKTLFPRPDQAPLMSAPSCHSWPSPLRNEPGSASCPPCALWRTLVRNEPPARRRPSCSCLHVSRLSKPHDQTNPSPHPVTNSPVVRFGFLVI